MSKSVIGFPPHPPQTLRAVVLTEYRLFVTSSSSCSRKVLSVAAAVTVEKYQQQQQQLQYKISLLAVALKVDELSLAAAAKKVVRRK